MAEVTLQKSLSAPKTGENTWLWLLKLVTGPLILVLIVVHFVVNHYIGSNGLLTYREILNYYRIWIVPIMEGLFLVLVVSHALLGLRSIILDMHPSRSVLNLINWLFLIAGVVSVVYGIWLIRVVVANIHGS